MQLSLTNRLLIQLQDRIPARRLGRLVYQLSRCEIRWIKNLLIRGFVWLYCVNKSEATERVPSGYKSFNAFFTRKLKGEVRSFDGRPGAIISPADGTVAQSGVARAGQLLQAKGMYFSGADLLGDTQLAEQLSDCAFSTIYLAPHNYHRLHMPIDGVLEQTFFIPGLLYSVNARTTASIANLYAVNERLVCHFRNEAGPFAMVLVGAMNVASITTAWGGEIMAGEDGGIIHTVYAGQADAPRYARGDYMGHFNLGSTVVFIAPTGDIDWLPVAAPGERIQVGQAIGFLPDGPPN
jgi:phosphatidylserine decarboxylase